MNRLFQSSAPAYVHIGAIFRKSRIQGAKGIALKIQITSEMRLQRLRIFLDLGSQAACFDRPRQIVK